MKDGGRRYLFLLAGLLVVVGLPVAGKLARRNGPLRCEFDGLRIEPVYQVRVLDGNGQSHRFCCPQCADHWLARQTDRPEKVLVTDEASGMEIDARSAYFVQSTVITNPITRSRLHAFRNRVDADQHLSQFGGFDLTEAERPFRRYQGSP
jgi:hypothetical protein